MKDCRIEQPVTVQANGCESRSEQNGHSEAAHKIEQSVEYMKQHLDKPLQVAALAAQVSISPSHYFALFKRCIGSAPIDFFTRLRMERARELLDGTELSVKEIATVLGYEDPFYFSRVFKSINRLAPSDYRSSHKNGANGKVNGDHNGLHSGTRHAAHGEIGRGNGGNLSTGDRGSLVANGSKMAAKPFNGQHIG